MATKNRLSGFRPTEKEHKMLEIMAHEYGVSMSRITSMCVRDFFRRNGFQLPVESKVTLNVEFDKLTCDEMCEIHNETVDKIVKEMIEEIQPGVINFKRN